MKKWLWLQSARVRGQETGSTGRDGQLEARELELPLLALRVGKK